VLAIAFSQCVLLDREFIAFDDRANFLDIANWRSGTLEQQASWALTTDRGHVFEPVAWIIKSLQFGTFGLSASGFVLVSTLAHCATAGVLFLTLHIITGEAAEFVAFPVLWWAVHPLRIECVCWCSAQPFVFAGLFGSLAIYCQALQGDKLPNPMLGVLEIFFFALAVLSKAVALPLCLISIALDLTVFRFKIETLSASAIPRITSATLRSTGKLVVAAVAAFKSIQANAESDVNIVLSFTDRLSLSMYCIAKYVTQSVVPMLLSLITYPDNSTDAKNGLDNTMYLGCLVLVVLVSLACIQRALFVSMSPAAVWFSFLVILAPTLPLMPHGTENVGADRYTYLATWAFLPALCYVCKALTTKIGGSSGACIGLGVLTVLAGYSASMSMVWSKNLSFYEHQIQTHSHRNPYFRETAIAYHEAGQPQKAVDLIAHNRENWKTFRYCDNGYYIEQCIYRIVSVLALVVSVFHPPPFTRLLIIHTILLIYYTRGWVMPELAGISLTYSKALLDLKQAPKAIQYLEEILPSAPKDGSADQLKANYAEALMNDKQNSKAYKVLKELESTNNKDLAALVKRALAGFTVKKN
jgi:hypothetical protein